jgi:hypothetical protein
MTKTMKRITQLKFSNQSRSHAMLAGGHGQHLVAVGHTNQRKKAK